MDTVLKEPNQLTTSPALESDIYFAENGKYHLLQERQWRHGQLLAHVKNQLERVLVECRFIRP